MSSPAYPLLVKQLLHTPLATAPEQVIVRADRGRHNYWTLRHRIGQLASALREVGVDPGDTVAMMDWDSHRYLEAYFAVPMMGAVLMTVNVRLAPDQVAYTLAHSGARALLVHGDFLPLARQVAERATALRVFVLLGDEPGAAPPGFAGEYESLLGAMSPEYEFPDFSEDSAATTFYTTGTTGLPKGVSFSHRQVVLHTLAAAAALGSGASQGRLHRDDVYLPLTPMFHVHAWGLPYVATLLGVKQVYPGRAGPEEILEVIEREGVTFSHCVPTLLHVLLAQPAIPDLRGWKVLVGGAAVPRALAQAARERGIDLFAGYGLSETGPILTIAQVRGAGDDELESRTVAGLPLPLVDLRTVDEALLDTPHDGRSPGEVVVRAPWLAAGYRDEPAASEALWDGGWLHTGDIGTLDEQGRLRITDRIKDVIKTGGEWVSSLALEDLLARHPGVSEAAVIAVEDAKWGERPLALVVRKPSHAGSLDAAELQRHLLRFADAGAVPRHAVTGPIVFVEALARTSVGKLDKKLLRRRYGRGANP